MSKFTTEQRLRVYEAALDLYKMHIKDSLYRGLCSCIYTAERMCELSSISTFSISDYLELEQERPEKEYFYWWPINEPAPRIKALKNCIESCKKQIANAR